MLIGLITNTYDIRKGTGIARYTKELLKGLKCKGFSVKLIHSAPPNIKLGKPFNHLVKLPLKTILSIRDCDVIHAMTPVAAFSFPFINKPKIVTHHELSFLFPYSHGKPSYVTIFSPLWYKIGTMCDRIITPSTLTKKDLIKYLNIPEDRISVTNLGVDEIFRPINLKENSKKDTFIIGYLGMLSYKKRVDYLIKSFWYLKNFHPEVEIRLQIYGKKTSEYYFHLVKLVRKLDLEKVVRFMGFTPDIVGAYNSFDVFVFPSEWEGFGLPILEAQRCGVPVVVRSDAHLPDEVVKWCVKAKSEEDMAEKLYQLLVDDKLRKKLIIEGMNYSKQFTWEKTVSETIKVYEEVINSR